MHRFRAVVCAAVVVLCAAAGSALATPVCTDGFKGGPPASACGGRIFPEALGALGYVQYTALPTGQREYADGLEYLAMKYPRWVSQTTLSKLYGKDAVSAGPDRKRPGDPADSGDGREIPVFIVTDHNVPDKGKRTLLFSLSVHGNERGGLEGGVRTAEDLAIAATNGGTIADGVDNYTSTTGTRPAFHSYEVRDLLAQEKVYFVDFNVDGWAQGDLFASPVTSLYARGNSLGTDLNRQMPTVGRIDVTRNPMEETETRFGRRLIDDVAAAGRGGTMDYGSDIHGETTSQAFMDIMYPAGQFDSVDHRRLMAIAERTKSVIDKTLFSGIADLVESVDGGNEAEGSLGVIPTKPAHWATVWDTLGYTDTGFIGDYLATESGVTGMDYEIFLNHSVPDKVWTVLLQENHINATRGIIKTAMAYALTQDVEFSPDTVKVSTGGGRAGYVVNPDPVTDTDANGAGTRPGPKKDGVGADGRPVAQAHYSATNMQWFADEARLMPTPFVKLASADVARDPRRLDLLDTLVLADAALPRDVKGRAVDTVRYWANIKAWVQRGGNLVLTDRALHALGDLGVVAASAVRDVRVYQPYANITDLGADLAKGLRANARQLVEAAILGYGIGNGASPMTVVDTPAWKSAGGAVVGTTGNGAGDSDDGTSTSIGQAGLGAGIIRIIGGALPTPTESNDHRYGLRDYAPTYTGTFLLENAIKHDVPTLGVGRLPADGISSPARACASRRTFTIRVSRPQQGRVRSATVTVNGRRVKVRKVAGRFTAKVDLRGVRDRAIVRITARTTAGRTVRETRRYKVCVARRKS